MKKILLFSPLLLISPILLIFGIGYFRDVLLHYEVDKVEQVLKIRSTGYLDEVYYGEKMFSLSGKHRLSKRFGCSTLNLEHKISVFSETTKKYYVTTMSHLRKSNKGQWSIRTIDESIKSPVYIEPKAIDQYLKSGNTQDLSDQVQWNYKCKGIELLDEYDSEYSKKSSIGWTEFILLLFS